MFYETTARRSRIRVRYCINMWTLLAHLLLSNSSCVPNAEMLVWICRRLTSSKLIAIFFLTQVSNQYAMWRSIIAKEIVLNWYPRSPWRHWWHNGKKNTFSDQQNISSILQSSLLPKHASLLPWQNHTQLFCFSLVLLARETFFGTTTKLV